MSILGPHLEASLDRPPKLIRFRSDPSLNVSLPPPIFSSTAAPQESATSVAFNTRVYAGGRFFASVPDGMSVTIAVTEHYGSCNYTTFYWNSTGSFCFDISSGTTKLTPCTPGSPRRATFADAPMFVDVKPVTITDQNGSASVGSLPLTFQVRPTFEECDSRIPQSSLPGGILSGLADGSVRFISQSVSQAAYWGSVTPDKREVV